MEIMPAGAEGGRSALRWLPVYLDVLRVSIELCTFTIVIKWKKRQSVDDDGLHGWEEDVYTVIFVVKYDTADEFRRAWTEK